MSMIRKAKIWISNISKGRLWLCADGPISIWPLVSADLCYRKGHAGSPIYTEPTVDGTQGKPRGTLEETYQQILSDLTTAESMLEGFVRSSSLSERV